VDSRCCAPVRQLSTAPRHFAFGLTRYRLPNSHPQKVQKVTEKLPRKEVTTRQPQKLIIQLSCLGEFEVAIRGKLETVSPHRNEGLFCRQLQIELLCGRRFPEGSNLDLTGQYPGSKPDCGCQRSGYRTSELADHDHGLDVPARKIATRLAEADNGWAKEVA
jgi:hypothetical protein